MSIIVDIKGKHLTAVEKELLSQPQVSGVILFKKNIYQHNPYQLSNLILKSQKLREERNLRPLIFCIDHEGGLITRFERILNLPSAKHIGDIYQLNPKSSISLIQKWYQEVNLELKNIGINLNFFPCVDLHNPISKVIGSLKRAYSSNINDITEITSKIFKVMKEINMPLILKHYPGHGNIEDDSHHSIAIDNRSKDEILHDLEIYRTLTNQADMIMTAHVMYPSIDNQNIASYSSTWLKEILRDNLKYNGVVISDCLSMAATNISDITPKEKIYKAYTAGCDMVIYSHIDANILLDNIKNINISNNHRLEKFLDEYCKKININNNISFETNYKYGVV